MNRIHPFRPEESCIRSPADLAAPRPGQFLSVSPRTRGARQVVLDVVGDVDAFTAPLLRACLHTQLTRTGVREVVLDLGRVGFFGAAGIAVVAEARQRCRERGMRLRLRSHGRLPVHRTLSLAEAIDRLGSDSDATGVRRNPCPSAGRTPRTSRSGSDAASSCP